MTAFEDTQAKVRECIKLARDVKQSGARLLDDCRQTGDAPVDVGPQLQEFNKRFAAFRVELDKLGIEQIDTRPELDPAASGSSVGELVDALRDLHKTHQEIIAAVQSLGGRSSERLGAIRQARDIFQKFVKPKDDRQPRFFDKKG